jgi:protocatechuate 3,4-dioxygenase beta subunit
LKELFSEWDVLKRVTKIAVSQRLAILGALLLAVQITAIQRGAPGSVEGLIVRLGTGDPLAEVDVELARVAGTASFPLGPLTYPPGDFSPGIVLRPTYPNPADLLHTRTNTDGRFSFSNLPPGTYRLLAARAGGAYYPAEYGQHHPRGRGCNFQLAEGQSMRDVKLEMAATSSISGRIVSPDGTPAARVQVMAFEASYQSGRRLLGLLQSAITDDRGEYRLFYLPPGRFFVGARFEDPQKANLSFRRYGQEVGTEILAEAPIVLRTTETGEVIEETFTTVYYGGNTDPASARPIDVASGASVNSIDILMTAGQPRAWHVRGTVVDSSGAPVRLARVRAIPRAWSPSLVAPVTVADANGVFDIPGVSPGLYYIRATTQSTGAMFSVEVRNGNVEGVRFVLSPGSTATGTVILEGRTPSGQIPDLSGLRVNLVPDHPLLAFANGSALNGNSFTIAGIYSGDYRVGVDPVMRVGTGPPYSQRPVVPAALENLYVKSVRMGGEEVLERGVHLQGQPPREIEVVLGVSGGILQGTVVDRRQQPFPNAVVAMVPASRRRTDLYKSTLTDASGGFRLMGLAPGEYRLFSWDYVEEGIWFDSEYLSSIETRGKSVRISEGTTESLELTVLGEDR